VQKKPLYNSFLKYTNQAIQMILVMVAGTLGGKYADEYFKTSFPYLTLIGVFFSVFAALYLALKDFLKK
jgi:hypothetical protein